MIKNQRKKPVHTIFNLFKTQRLTKNLNVTTRTMTFYMQKNKDETLSRFSDTM